MFDDDEDDDLDTDSSLYEAREWLQQNGNTLAFAGNRFDSTLTALDFVEQLYTAGGVMVYVTNVFGEKWRLEESGGPYADTLIVQLPADPEQRQTLFEIYRVEAEEEWGKEQAAKECDLDDHGQDEILFWWD